MKNMQEKHNETGGDIEQTETAIVPSPVPTSVPEKEASKMNSDQYAIFLKYWGMGSERSLDKLAQVLQEEAHQKGTQPAPKTPVHDTLKKWSGRFKWQELIQQMDEEANQKLFEEAIEAARQTRVDIMKIFRAVVLRFATQLKQNPTREMSTGDVVAFWRMARLEMGLSDGSGGSSNAPPARSDATLRPSRFAVSPGAVHPAALEKHSAGLLSAS